MGLADRLLKLRKVGQEDCELLWDWANDPIVRAVSFSSEPITWEDHLRWFNNKLNSSNCYHFIAFNDQDKPIGQIRFDIDDQLQSIVSVSLASNQRNQGYGKLILQMAINKLCKRISVSNIQALIKPDNLASIKLFESVGFKQLNLSSITPINTNISVLIYLP
jgi:UDP-2,4-diacetamido-2,4,6-trideoxy-beta-L-altropyranose hydrolase